MKLRETLILALGSMRGNMLRSVLTMLIIAFGIMAIVGILTAVEALKGSLNDSFSSLGSNTFNIRNRGGMMSFGRPRRNTINYPNITFSEAKRFEENYHFPSQISVTVNCSYNAIVQYDDEKTQPNITVIGGSEKYIANTGLKINKGRNFSVNELQFGAPVCVLGQEVAEKLFGKKNIEPIDQQIQIQDKRFRVVGVLLKAGSSMGFNPDRWCIVPLSTARFQFVSERSSYAINVKVDDVGKLDAAVDEATGVMRGVRRLAVADENNFQINRSDGFARELDKNIVYLRLFAFIIGLITLLGATIGLMNIMLVSVTERTQEIGIRKALGARPTDIMKQFLLEALAICQFGGFAGILLGIIVGNIVAALLHTSFVVPWNWIVFSYILCCAVGIIAGYYPARKAAKLNPIDALRYE